MVPIRGYGKELDDHLETEGLTIMGSASMWA